MNEQLTFWQNRIVRYGEEDPEQLLANELNPRIHPAIQQAALEGSLEEIGWIQDIIVNLRTSEEWGVDRGVETLVDGHLRVKLALRHGQPKVPVKYVDLSPAQERLAMATLDPITGYATIDTSLMSSLLDGIEIESSDLSSFVAMLAEDLNFEWGEDEPPEDPGPQIDRAEELQEKWQVQRGQVWQIGRHRLMCGDSTSAEDVGQLMGGDKYPLMVTDPPYGVSYAAKNEFLNTIARGNRIQTPIEKDHQTPEQMSAFWTSAFSTIRPFAASGASYYVTGPQGGDLLLLLLALRDSGFPLRHMLIWAKNNHVLGRSDYNYKHEPIIYGWVGGSHKFYRSFDVSLWEIDKPQKSDLHPTTKPVELYTRAIRNSSAPGEVVVDWFVGAGTLFVACEQSGRIGYGMEVTEHYCAVTLERLTGMGLEARLVEEASNDG